MQQNTYQDRSDEAVMAEYFCREAAVKEEMCRRYAGVVAAVAKRRRRKGQTREDLQQDLWEEFLRALPRYQPGRGTSFAAFIGTTLEGRRKKSIEKSQMQAVRDFTISVRMGGPAMLTKHDAYFQLSEEELAEKLKSLPLKGRKRALLWILFREGDVSSVEIAGRWHVSSSAVRTEKARLRKTWKAFMEQGIFVSA